MIDNKVFNRIMNEQGYIKLVRVSFTENGKNYVYGLVDEEVHAGDYLVVEVDGEEKYVLANCVYWTLPEDSDYNVYKIKMIKRVVVDDNEKTKAYYSIRKNTYRAQNQYSSKTYQSSRRSSSYSYNPFDCYGYVDVVPLNARD